MATVQTFEEEFLTCGICTDLFSDPCTLNCGHSLCRSCLINFLRTRPEGVRSGKIPCPFCRQLTPVPDPSKPKEQWAEHLKSSLILQGLMDRHCTQHKEGKGKDLCFLCKEVGETTSSSSWCSDCEMTLCRRCAKMHLAGPSTKKHDVFDLSEGDKVKERRKVKCKEHEGEEMKFICKNCNKAVCQTCCLLKHAKHNFITIESFVPEMKAELVEKRENLDNKMKYHMKNVRAEQLKIEELKRAKSQTVSQIKSDVNSAINLLREKERTLLSELDDTSDRQIQEHQAIVKSGQITIQMYQQHSEFVDQALKSKSEGDMYDMYQVCMSGVVDYVGGTYSDTSNISVEGKVMFTPNMEPLTEAIAKMGDIKIFNPMSHSPVFQDTIIVEHQQDAMSYDPVDVTVLVISGGEAIVIADGHNQCLKSVYVGKKKKEISRLKLSSRPNGISKMVDNKVAAALSDNHIVITEVRPQLVLVSTLKTKKQYWDITSLSDSRLAVGSDSPPTVDILDLSGNVLKSFTPHNTGLNLIQSPYYLSTTHEGNILVSDHVSYSVYCLTPEGDVVFTNKSKEGRALIFPSGITVTDIGDILVADSVSKKIYQLSTNGTYVKDVLTSSDGINEPYNICIDDTYKLYVCDGRHGSQCIKVFSFM